MNAQKNNPSTGFKTTQKTVSVYKVRQVNRFTWADVVIDEWAGGGSFMANSDFGAFAYVWNSIGSETLREFLCGLDYGYFMEKTHPSHGERFSAEKTIKKIKADLLEARRDGSLDAEASREVWDEIEDLADESPDSETAFFMRLDDTFIPEHLYQYDYSAIGIGKERDPQCAGFWNEIWPELTRFWKAELGLEGKGT